MRSFSLLVSKIADFSVCFFCLPPLSPYHQGERSWSSLTASPQFRTQTLWQCWTSSVLQNVASTQSCSATDKDCSGNWWRNRLFYNRNRSRHFADWQEVLHEGQTGGWQEQSSNTLWMKAWGRLGRGIKYIAEMELKTQQKWPGEEKNIIQVISKSLKNKKEKLQNMDQVIPMVC